MASAGFEMPGGAPPAPPQGAPGHLNVAAQAAAAAQAAIQGAQVKAGPGWHQDLWVLGGPISMFYFLLQLLSF